MLKVATDCTGIGCPELAIRNLGIEHEVVFACEKDKFARQTYTANFQPTQMFNDITTRDNRPSDLYSDLYIAGFPCQAFSLSGKRKGFDDVRGTIFFNCADYIEKHRPKAFILENVKGLLSHDRPAGSKAKHGRTFQTIINVLGETINGQMLFSYYEDALNYNLHYQVLNTRDFGLPQNRERVFIVGIRNDLPNDFRFPKKTPLTKKLKDVLEENVDKKYFLSDKMVDYLLKRKDNFNNGKLNLKTSDDVASTITSSSSSLDISDNIVVVNDNGILKEQKEHTNCIDANYGKGMDNHAQRPIILSYIRDGKGKVTSRHLKDVANTIHTGTGGGGNTDQYVFALAIRGRGVKGKLKQEAEPRFDGVTNTLTSVGKDNYIGIVPKEDEDLVVHSLFPRSSKTGKGGTGHLTKNDVPSFCLDTTNSQAIELKQVGSLYEDNNDAGRIYSEEGLSCTLKAQGGGLGAKTGLYNIKGMLRKLTPLECFRLQGFPDSFNKPCSDSQLYKQAGNSISEPVIRAVMTNVLPCLS